MSAKNAAVKQRKKRSWDKGWYIGLLFLLPWIIGFLTFDIYPLFASMYYSFTNFGLGAAYNFVGLANYINIFTNDLVFRQSLTVTLIYTLFAVPGRILFALFIAMILNWKLRGIGIFRTAYYLPSILGGSVAVAVLWRAIFMHNGAINSALSFFTDEPVVIHWLGSPDLALIPIIILAVWQFGSSMVLFLAGLKQVPAELYEAAIVDGAKSWRVFISITLPMISPIILFNLVMQTVNAFQDFTGAFILTGGGPLRATYLYGIMLYETGFIQFRMGYASALSWVLFVIIIAMTAVIFKTSGRWTHYEDGRRF